MAISSKNRVALATIPETDINISINRNKNNASKSYLLQTPLKRKLLDENNNKNKRQKHESELNNYLIDDDSNVFSSPRLQRARTMKLKLQLAYYKVKTNQTEVPLNSLKVPESPLFVEDNNNDHGNYTNSSLNTKSSNALTDLLAVSTPLLVKSKKTRKSAQNLNIDTDGNNSINGNNRSSMLDIMATSKGKKNKMLSKKSSMHDIVTKRGTSANLKRVSLEFLKSNNNSKSLSISIHNDSITNTKSQNIDNDSNNNDNINNNNNKSISYHPSNNKSFSAPASITTFNFPYPNSGFSNMTSPSKFSISLIDKQKVKLPPIPNSVSNVSPIEHLNSLNSNSNSLNSKNDAEGNSITNETTSTPSNKRIENIIANSTLNEFTKNLNSKLDPDSTILQNTSLLVTPIRKSNLKKISKINSNSLTKDHSIDQDETQLMSSPTRLLTTPSSMGAAHCLLQLAHR